MTAKNTEYSYGRLAQLSAEIKIDIWRERQRQAQRKLLLAIDAEKLAAKSHAAALRYAAYCAANAAIVAEEAKAAIGEAAATSKRLEEPSP